MYAIYLKELYSYLQSGVGFVFLAFFLLLSGVFFTISNLFGAGSSDFRLTLANIALICLVTIPMLTMRLLAEERKSRTDQLLLTSPLGVTSIVLGKYFAAVSVYLMGLVCTIAYPLMLDRVGLVATSEVAGGYLGVSLLGASFIAVGLYVSSLTENQFFSALATFGVLLSIAAIDWLYRSLPGDSVSGLVFALAAACGVGLFVYHGTRSAVVGGGVFGVASIVVAVLYAASPSGFEGLLVKTLRWLSLIDRVKSFNNGVLDLAPVVYYLTFSAMFVFLTIQVLERRRWK